MVNDDPISVKAWTRAGDRYGLQLPAPATHSAAPAPCAHEPVTAGSPVARSTDRKRTGLAAAAPHLRSRASSCRASRPPGKSPRRVRRIENGGTLAPAKPGAIKPDPFHNNVAAFTCGVVVAEIPAGLRSGEEAATESFFHARGDIVIDATTGWRAESYLARYAGSHGVEIVDALVATTAATTGLLLFTLNRKRYAMRDVRFLEA